MTAETVELQAGATAPAFRATTDGGVTTLPLGALREPAPLAAIAEAGAALDST